MSRQAIMVSNGFVTLTTSLFAQSSVAAPEQVQATKDIHEFLRIKTQKLASADLADMAEATWS